MEIHPLVININMELISIFLISIKILLVRWAVHPAAVRYKFPQCGGRSSKSSIL